MTNPSARIIYINPSRSNPLNPLGASTRIHLLHSLRSALDDPSVRFIILTGGTDGAGAFSVGADIREFSSFGKKQNDKEEAPPPLTELCDLYESSTKPIIAAVNGHALGGGLELALSCHYRVVSASCSSIMFGLPEVKLGLIPGAGGTQRLPRLCALEWALEVVTSGRNVRVQEAQRMGLVDGCANEGESLLECAERWGVWSSDGFVDYDHVRVSKRKVRGDVVAMGRLCDKMMKKCPERDLGGEAVRDAIAAVRASFEKESFEEGMEVESKLFWKLLMESSQGRARRYAFFAERAAAQSRKATGKAKKVTSIGIIGAGTMGSGIALSFLRAKFSPVVLIDTNNHNLTKASQFIQKTLHADVMKKRISSSMIQSMGSALQTSTDINNVANCHLILEAVFENLKLKRTIFRQLDKIVTSPEVILLTNTSTLDIASISSTSFSSPQSRLPNFAGMHFFSPAHIMKLVEIIHTPHTSPSTISLLRSITKRLNKVGVVVGNGHGFVGNRMLFPYTSESAFVLEEYANRGLTVGELDGVVQKWGMKIGPMVMGDLAGNDIGYLIRKEQGLVRDPKTGQVGPNRSPSMRYTELGDDLVAKLGRVGQKALKGWYDYDKKIGKGRHPLPSQEVQSFIQSYPTANTTTTKHQNVDDFDIISRVLYPLVNEGFKILEEGIAEKPSDIDVIYLYGYGWPVWRGGPMYWADHEVGLEHLLRKLETFSKLYPGSDYYTPSPLLRKCVALGIGVGEYYSRLAKEKKRSNISSRL